MNANPGLKLDNISSWSTELQDEFMSYLTTNYGEQFLTGDTLFSRLTEKHIVGYDVDFDSNTITSLVKGVMSGGKLYTGMRTITLSNTTADDVVEEFLKNNTVRETSDAFSKNDQGQIVFNGEIVTDIDDANDMISITALEGKFGTSSSLLNQIDTTPTASYAVDELDDLLAQYKKIFEEEALPITQILYSSKSETGGVTQELGYEGLTFGSAVLGIAEDGSLVRFTFGVEAEYAADTFLKIDPTKHEYVARGTSIIKTFGGQNSIIRLKPMGAEASVSMEK